MADSSCVGVMRMQRQAPGVRAVLRDPRVDQHNPQHDAKNIADLSKVFGEWP